MATFTLPYGRSSQEVRISERRVSGILTSSIEDIQPSDPEILIIENALERPLHSSSLESLAKGRKNIVIITSDHTRPVPSHLTLPPILSRIRASAPDSAITILVATGYHRAPARKELIEKFGEDIVREERIAIHDSRNDAAMVKAGVLPSGGELLLNRLAVDADLLIADGFIEPHFFAGFSGGRKSVLPGIAGYRTVLANHCAKFIDSPFAKAGILDNNPIHRDMCFAAREVGLAFIVNVILNSSKEVVAAYAGHPFKAHERGCDFLAKHCRVQRKMADIVITTNGGYPLDQNIYQAVKGLTAAERCCKQGGIIIMVAACSDGHGGESFYTRLAEASSPAALLEKVRRTPMDRTVPDQWEYQILARILSDYQVILVTDQCDPKIIKDMHMQHAFPAQSALDIAFRQLGGPSTVTVIPNGTGVIVQ